MYKIETLYSDGTWDDNIGDYQEYATEAEAEDMIAQLRLLDADPWYWQDAEYRVVAVDSALTPSDIYGEFYLEGRTDARTAPDEEEDQRLCALWNAAPDLLAACEALITTEAISPLGECAYQGPPPKSWIKERTAYAKGFNDCLDRLQPVARAAIAAARGE